MDILRAVKHGPGARSVGGTVVFLKDGVDNVAPSNVSPEEVMKKAVKGQAISNRGGEIIFWIRFSHDSGAWGFTESELRNDRFFNPLPAEVLAQ